MGDLGDASHQKLSLWLERVCLVFVALGVTLPVVYATAPFALYRSAIADAIGDASLVEGPTAQLALGLTGGSIAGKWLAHWAIVRFGIRARRRWALQATWAGLFTWFIVDSVSSLLGGAWANVAMVNPLPILVVSPLAWRLSRACDLPPAAPGELRSGPAPLALASAIAGIVSGLVIAFAMSTPVFTPWWEGLADAHFGGAALRPSARALVRFFAGPIGGSTAGQFVLLAFVARHAMSERWSARWCIASLLAWALTDSLWSLAAGGAFNVILVNLPCLVLACPPWLWSLAKARSRVT